jgi:hypothetical protein
MDTYTAAATHSDVTSYIDFHTQQHAASDGHANRYKHAHNHTHSHGYPGALSDNPAYLYPGADRYADAN